MSVADAAPVASIDHHLEWLKTARDLVDAAGGIAEDGALPVTVVGRIWLARDAVADAHCELRQQCPTLAGQRLADAVGHLTLIDVAVDDQAILDKTRNAHQLVIFVQEDRDE